MAVRAYDEISKRRMYRSAGNYRRIKHGYAANKFASAGGKRGKGIHNFAFHPSDVGMLLIFHKYDGLAHLIPRSYKRGDVVCAKIFAGRRTASAVTREISFCDIRPGRL